MKYSVGPSDWRDGPSFGAHLDYGHPQCSDKPPVPCPKLVACYYPSCDCFLDVKAWDRETRPQQWDEWLDDRAHRQQWPVATPKRSEP